MQLDIYVEGSRPGEVATEAPVVSFFDEGQGPGPRYDDDTGGYYWFLEPLFQRLVEKTGQYIDLYGDAEFRGDDLKALRETLREARQLVEAQPERWSVYLGMASMPNATPPVAPWEVLKEVERSKFLEIIDTLLEIVDHASAHGTAVICFGD
jgi:hypothetical protein